MKSIKIIAASVLFLTLTSCNFAVQWGEVTGNGNVVTEERPITESFNAVKGSAGLDIYLTQGSESKIVVEADENLLENITTEIHNGTLKIGTEKSIGRSKSKKVHVTFVTLDEIAASSGSDVIGNSIIRNETLSLSSSSGADLEVDVEADELYADVSSGADLKISGRANRLIAEASSGSDLKAKDLEVNRCKASASSGADIVVHVLEEMDGRASSGGDIKYYGNPTAVSVNDGTSGSVRKM